MAAAIVDLPTPPLPDPTAITFLMPGDVARLGDPLAPDLGRHVDLERPVAGQSLL